jgi:hypothetical protein
MLFCPVKSPTRHREDPPAFMLTWAVRLVLAASVLVSAITWNQRRNPTGTLIIFSRSPLPSRFGSLRLAGNWNIDGLNCWKMPLVFVCRFFPLARQIFIEAGQAICSIPGAGPHSESGSEQRSSTTGVSMGHARSTGNGLTLAGVPVRELRKTGTSRPRP